MNPVAQDFAVIFFLALAVASISLTISKAKISETFRSKVAQRSAWTGKMLNCPYCTSHWVSFPLAALYQPYLLSTKVIIVPYLGSLLDWFITSMAIVAVANLVMWPIVFAYRRWSHLFES